MNNCTSFQRKYSFVIIIPGFTSYTEEMATSLYYFDKKDKLVIL